MKRTNLGVLLSVVLWMPLAWPAAVLLWQASRFAQAGAWIEAPFAALFLPVSEVAFVPDALLEWPWFYQPQSWLGIHMLLSKFSYFLSLPVAMVLIYTPFALLVDLLLRDVPALYVLGPDSHDPNYGLLRERVFIVCLYPAQLIALIILVAALVR